MPKLVKKDGYKKLSNTDQVQNDEDKRANQNELDTSRGGGGKSQHTAADDSNNDVSYTGTQVVEGYGEEDGGYTSQHTAISDSITINGGNGVSCGKKSDPEVVQVDNDKVISCDENDDEKQYVNGQEQKRSCSIGIADKKLTEMGNQQAVDGMGNKKEHARNKKKWKQEQEQKQEEEETRSGEDSEKGLPEGYRVGDIPDCTIASKEEQLTANDDQVWHYIDENDPENMENQILANCPYRLYLITTFQWRPYTNKWQEQRRRWVPFCCGQIVAFCLLALSFVFDGGWFCKVDTALTYDWKFEITRIRNILWEARWLLGNLIGLWYFRTRHLEWFLEVIRMPKNIWSNFYKRASYFMTFLMLMCIFIPTGIQVFVINVYSKETPSLGIQTAHLIGYTLRRYITFPIFLALISMLYLLDLFINVSGELVTYRLLYALRIGVVEEDKEKEKEKQDEIKRATKACLEKIGRMKEIIFKTENGVKYFMLFHLVMLLVTSFLGIFSYMERLEFSVAPSTKGNSTDHLSSLTRALDNKKVIAQERIREAMVNLMQSQKAHKFTANNQPLTLGLAQVFNETLRSISDVSQEINEENLKMVLQTKAQQSIGVKLKEQINRTRLYVQIGLDCAETALLYGLPLFLLIKIDSSVAALKETMIGLQAKQKSLKFDMTKQAWDVISFMNTVRGVRVFGFQSTLFRTLILTFAGPVLLSVVHSLLAHVKMSK